MKRMLVLILSISISIISFSQSLVGIGVGESEKIAKKEAIADLSTQIQVSVKTKYSSSKSLENGNFSNRVDSDIATLTNIDLLGVEFDVKKKWLKNKYTVTATIDESKVAIYEKSINELRSGIINNYNYAINSDDIKEKKEYLNTSLKHYKLFNSYATVAMILGSENNYIIPVTQAKIKNEIETINKTSAKQSNKINFLFIKSSGEFGSNSRQYFDNYFNNMITDISKENSRIAISSDNSSQVTTLIKVVLNTKHTSIRPAVYYNKKMITPDTYLTTLNTTVEFYDKNKLKNILTLTSSGEGEDTVSQELSYEKAVKNAFDQVYKELKEILK